MREGAEVSLTYDARARLAFVGLIRARDLSETLRPIAALAGHPFIGYETARALTDGRQHQEGPMHPYRAKLIPTRRGAFWWPIEIAKLAIVTAGLAAFILAASAGVTGLRSALHPLEHQMIDRTVGK